MAKLTRLEMAKEQTRGKFEGILRDLSGMTRVGFGSRVGEMTTCGFCNLHHPECTRCQFREPCKSMLKQRYLIDGMIDWMGAAEELCKFILEEVDKVKEDTTNR